MRRIFLFISIGAITIGLIGYLFKLPEYDLFVQLSKIEALNFINPIEHLQNLIESANGLFDFKGQDISWYEYIPLFFQWLGAILSFPILLVKDIAINLLCGLKAILLILGF